MKRTAVLLLFLSFIFCRVVAQGSFSFGERLAVVRCEEFVTMREVPEKRGRVLAKLPLATKVYFTGEVTEGYASVYCEAGEGWVLTEYLESASWESGEMLAPDAAAKIRLNLFLTAFAGTGLSRYRLSWTDPSSLLDLVILRRVLMEPSAHQEGSWPEGDRRMESDGVYQDGRRYFGQNLRGIESHRYPLREGRFYWNTEDTPALSGFAVVKTAERLREDVLLLRLGIYGIGQSFTPEGVCMFDARGARSAYPKAKTAEALALVHTALDWEDESAWRLLMFLRREMEGDDES